MILQAVALLTLSAGFVLSAPQNRDTSENTQAAIENDIKSMTQNLVAAGRNNVPAFDPESFGALFNPAQLPLAFSDPSFGNLEKFSKKDLQLFEKLAHEYAGNASGAAADVMQKRRRREAKEETSSPAEPQTEGFPFSDEALSVLGKVLEFYKEQQTPQVAE